MKTRNRWTSGKVGKWAVLALLTFSLSHLLTFPATGRRGLLLNRGSGGGGGGDACSSCTNETFEGAGDVLSGWSEQGSGPWDEDYATAPAPIIGSHSLVVRGDAFGNSYARFDMPSAAEGWIRMAVVFTNTIVTNWYVARLLDSGGAPQANLAISGTGGLMVNAGGSFALTTATLVAGRTNYIWFHYLKGSGANAVADVGFAEHPTKTRPTGGNNFAQVTAGTSTANLLECWIGGGDSAFTGAYAGAIYDNVSLTSTAGPIGNFP